MAKQNNKKKTFKNEFEKVKEKIKHVTLIT